MPSEKIDPMNIPDNINKMNRAVTEASNIPASIKQIIPTENTNINIFFRPNRSLNIPRGNCVIMLPRSEEHTYELQSRFDIVCRLLLEKKKTISITYI